MTGMDSVNFLTVLVAAVVGVFGVGGLWYSPLLFGTMWKRAAGVDHKKKEGHPALVFGVSFIMGLLSAFGFALVLTEGYDLLAAVHSGIFVGAFFVATSFSINYLFSGRSFKLFAIDAGYHIAQFAVYGLIFGLWR